MASETPAKQTSAKHNRPQPVPARAGPVIAASKALSTTSTSTSSDDIEPGISGRNNLEILRACEMLCRSSQEQRTVRRDEVS